MGAKVIRQKNNWLPKVFSSTLLLLFSMGDPLCSHPLSILSEGRIILRPNNGAIRIGFQDTIAIEIKEYPTITTGGVRRYGDGELTLWDVPDGISYRITGAIIEDSGEPDEHLVSSMTVFQVGDVSGPSVSNILIGRTGRPSGPSRVFRLTLFNPTEQYFELVTENDSIRIGTTKVIPIQIVRAPSFSEPVTLSVDNHPDGVQISFPNNPVSGSLGQMRIEVSGSANEGTYQVTIRGTSGNVERATTMSLKLFHVYVLDLSPNTITLSRGQITTINVNVSGSSSHVLPATLNVPTPWPAGITFQFNPITTNFTSTLTVAVGTSVQPGTYPVQVTARFANDTIRTATLNLTVNATSGWTPQFETLGMQAMDMLDATQTGLAVSSGSPPFVFRSTDGGRNWVGITAFDPGTYYGLSMVFQQRAVIVGLNGACYLSLDAGTTWSSRSSGTTRALHAVSFSDVANAVAVGDRVITRTTDGGSSWSVVPEIGPYDFWDVSYIGGSAFAVGQNGVIFRATGYQDNWEPLISGTPEHLWGVSFVSTSTGMVVGDGGTILYTSDAGATWQQRPRPGGVTTRIQRVAMLNATTATVGGFNKMIYQTTDAGVTWAKDTVLMSSSFDIVHAIHLSPDNSGLCLVQVSNQNTRSLILRRE